MIPRSLNFILLILVNFVSSYEILLMCPFPAPSHWLWIEHFARGLVDRGHHVTAVTNHRTKQPHPNYTEIIIDPPFDIPYYFPKREIFNMKFNSDFHNLFMWWGVGTLTAEYALNDTNVKQLIRSKYKKFDLFILEQFFHESFLMFGHKFKVPIVTLGTFGYADNMDRAMGLITPWSYVPHIVLSYKDNMTFLQRAYNTLISTFDFVMRRLYYLPKQQDIANRHFQEIEAEAGPLPSVIDLERNISLMLINSHRSTNPPRPSMPGLINVGGIHIKPPKPLPNDIQKFLDEAEHGVIYFSLGSYIKSNDMPKEKVTVILNTFKKLKQRVIWKYEDASIGTLPNNVMIGKWMPQSDILAHKNIVLFITHGGIFGTQEGIYQGVPMLYMPLYGDQHRNALQAVQEGYALKVSFKDLSVETLYPKIQTILYDKSFTKRAREISAVFRDNPMHPMDESMYWIEYIARHHGAGHLKSNAIHLAWYQYLLLDVLAFYLAIIATIIYVTYKIIGLSSKLFFGYNVFQTSFKKKMQ